MWPLWDAVRGPVATPLALGLCFLAGTISTLHHLDAMNAMDCHGTFSFSFLSFASFASFAVEFSLSFLLFVVPLYVAEMSVGAARQPL